MRILVAIPIIAVQRLALTLADGDGMSAYDGTDKGAPSVEAILGGLRRALTEDFSSAWPGATFNVEVAAFDMASAQEDEILIGVMGEGDSDLEPRTPEQLALVSRMICEVLDRDLPPQKEGSLGWHQVDFRMKVKFMDYVALEQMVNQSAPTSVHTAHHTSGGNPLDWLHLSREERTLCDKKLGNRTALHQQRDGDFDLSEYAAELKPILTDLQRLDRMFAGGAATVADVRSAYESTIRRCQQLLDQLKNELSTGLQNGYVRRR
jgi:hypothetical protein